MNYRKTSPVGIDLEIDRMQKRIYQPLVDRWGSLDIYGRVYSNLRDNGDGGQEYVLERYVGDGEYEPVLFNEGSKIFFLQGNNVAMNFGEATNDLWIVAIIDIAARSGAHRADEEVHSDLITVLSNTYPTSTFEEIRYGIENLRSLANETFDDTNFRFSDIHPSHVFMVRMSVSYTLIEK